MNYTVLSGHTGIHGSLMNLLDLTDYLIRHGHFIDFVCMDRFHLEDKLKESMRTYQMQEIYDIETLTYKNNWSNSYISHEMNNKLTDGKVIRRKETIITDFKSLISWPTEIICDKIIILDNAELSYHLNNIIIDFYPKDIGNLYTVLRKHTFNEHVFCMPAGNLKTFQKKYPDLNSRLFYKKINIEALCTARASDNGKFFYRGENPPKGMKKLAEPLDDLTKIFEYSGYVYYRRDDRAKYEQLGRMVFEFIILDKKVIFFEQPGEQPDGLNDYWKHYADGDRDTIIQMMLEDYEDAPWE